MNTITIQIQSEEYETLAVELTAEEVTALYKLRKENQLKLAELEKKITTIESNHKYTETQRDKAVTELTQAHTLLTALGIPDKTDHEESYYRKDLEVTTRLALYIAKEKK